MAGQIINNIDMQSFKDCGIDIHCANNIIVTDFASMSSKLKFTKIYFIAYNIVKGKTANPETKVISWDNNHRIYEGTICLIPKTNDLRLNLNGNAAQIQLHDSTNPIYLFAHRAEDDVLLIWMTNKPLDKKKKNSRRIIQSFADVLEKPNTPGIVLVHKFGISTVWNDRTPTQVNIDINDYDSFEVNFKGTSYFNTLPSGSIRNRIMFEIKQREDGHYYLDAGAPTSDPISLTFDLKKKTKCVKIYPAMSPTGTTIIFNIKECK